MSVNATGIQKKENFSNPEENEAVERLKMWQIDPFFKCPVVGSCLTLAEQRQILKKLGISNKKKSPYEIHEIFVANSDSSNRISKKADALLHRKYGQRAEELLTLDNDSFMSRFKSQFESGDSAVSIWAAAVNPKLSIELKREVFGTIHMSMHDNGTERAKDRSKLHRNQKALDDLRRKFQQTIRHSRTLQKKNHRLEQERKELKAFLSVQKVKNVQTEGVSEPFPGHLKNREDTFHSGKLKRKNRSLEEELNIALAQLEEKKSLLTAVRTENRRLSSELERQVELNQRLREEMPRLLDTLKQVNRCESTCASFNLCKKRILMVGGITRMEALYRELIEGSGGIFEYHDGYMNKGVKGLETRLKRADMVLCPVSCNSHAACSIVKNLAKKHNKRLHMLANSSLSTLSQIIWAAETQPDTANSKQIQ